jgi:PAS domain S-box-containing protein
VSDDERNGSLRSTQEALRAVLAEVAERPAELGPILDASPASLVAFDAARNVLYANARAEALFGYERGALGGQSTDVLIPARLRQPDAPAMMLTDDLMQVELPGLLRDGSERPIEWCFGGARVGARAVFVMTVRDRRELDLALEQLRASEERFQLLVNGVRDWAIFLLDESGRVSSWNTGAERIKGWTAAEIVGRPYEVFFSEDDRAASVPARHLAATVEEGNHETTGWRVRKDGTRFWAHASLTALRSPAGQLRGFAKVTRDLTDRLRAEEAEHRLIVERAAREAAQRAEQRVRESEEKLSRLQRITAAFSEAVTPHDVAAVVFRECLPAAAAAGAIVYQLAEGADELTIVDHHGHDPPTLAAFSSLSLDGGTALADAIRDHAPGFYESRAALAEQYPALRANIEAVEFEAAAMLPLVANGKALGGIAVRYAAVRSFDAAERSLLLTMSDLCAQALERARLFAAERAARASAEAASRAKDEFLAMLGHELRNPLAPISTAVQVMKMKGDGGARECDVIERQVAHIGRLVDDLLDVSRVARGLVTLSRAEVDLAGVIDKAVEMASPLFEQRRQRLDISLPEEPLHVDADAMRLAQVFGNLLTNAAKYTPEGGHVRLDARRDGSEVVVRVRDDGEGIAADLLPVIFDRFVQGERTIERSQGGLGLGLALVKSLVTLHGGTVAAASDGVGKGSEFVVRVPALAARRRPSPAPPAFAKPAPTARGKRILVVDDNEDAGEMLAHMLRLMGHEVAIATDGPAALEQLESFPAEVAILDIGLPVMDGFELARRVCEGRADRRPRLIALTGYGQQRDIEISRSAGFDVHLVKPVDMPKLIKAIDPG